MAIAHLTDTSYHAGTELYQTTTSTQATTQVFIVYDEDVEYVANGAFEKPRRFEVKQGRFNVQEGWLFRHRTKIGRPCRPFPAWKRASQVTKSKAV